METASAFRPHDIRNVVLLGHGGSGKTTLAEALLHRAGAIPSQGTVEAASTTSDFEPEAKAHHHSTSTSLLFATYEGREVNLLDTPGHPDFAGLALAALPAVETAVIVVSGVAGIERNTRRLFHAAGKAGLARMIVVNKIDAEPARLPALLSSLRAAFGATLHCINLPSAGGTDVVDCFDRGAGVVDFGDVAKAHREMVEATVEADDAQLDKYLAGEPIELSDLRKAFVKAMVAGQVVPVLFASARSGVGIDDLLHILVEEAPSPVSGRPRRLRSGDALIDMPCDADRPFIGQVFQVSSDPALGPLAMVRILQGRLDGTTAFVCGEDKKPRTAGKVRKIEGREHPALDAQAFAGDLVGLAQVEDIHVNQILHDPAITVAYAPVLPDYPAPLYAMAIAARSRSEDVKLALALQRLAEEDPTFRFEQDALTHEIVAFGVGELHLQVCIEKLKNRAHVDVTARHRAVAYRETIAGEAEGHHRHRKAGAAGAEQFGEVFLRVEPLGRGKGIAVESEVVSASIPPHLVPAAEQGAREALALGPLGGFPLTDVRVTITDGRSHPVEAGEPAFRTAGKLAARDALGKARPLLIEPIANLEITAPAVSVSDVTGFLRLHRGQVVAIEAGASGWNVIRAQAPVAELYAFDVQLRGMTGDHGSYAMELSHYDAVPHDVQQTIVAARHAQLLARQKKDASEA